MANINWDQLRKDKTTVSEALAKNYDCSHLLLTLADLSSELAQYAMRMAVPGGSLYKCGSFMDLEKYMVKVSTFMKAADHKMKEHEELAYGVKSAVLKEMHDHYVK